MRKNRKKKNKENQVSEDTILKNQKMCLRKRIFWNANAAAGRAGVLSEKTKKVWYSYKCPNCLQWHLARAKEQ